MHKRSKRRRKKNPAAVALGKARLKTIPAARRAEIARQAALARWRKKPKESV